MRQLLVRYILTHRSRSSVPRGRSRLPRLPVVASFSILADLTRNIGGDRVEVVALVGPDGDAHAYQPTPADAKALARRKARRRERARLRRLDRPARQDVWDDGAGRRRDEGCASPRKDEDAQGGTDPHAWQSIANAKNLCGQYSRRADRGRSRRGGALSRQCGRLSRQARGARGRGPGGDREESRPSTARSSRPTMPSAISASAYGLDFIAPEGVSTEAEPSARDVARIIRQIKAQRHSRGLHGEHHKSAHDPPDRGRKRGENRRHLVLGRVVATGRAGADLSRHDAPQCKGTLRRARAMSSARGQEAIRRKDSGTALRTDRSDWDAGAAGR